MENVNKFKVFTIAIICTFVFAIAAIYTNTKEVTGEKNEGSTVQTDNSYTNYNSGSSYSTELDDLRQKVEELGSRMDNADRHGRVNTSSTELKCRIAGTLNGRGMEEMSPSAAVNDAKINNNDLVVLCSF